MRTQLLSHLGSLGIHEARRKAAADIIQRRRLLPQKFLEVKLLAPLKQAKPAFAHSQDARRCNA